MVADEHSFGLAALYLRHQGELLRFLTARTGDPDQAADLVQELWLKASSVAAGPVGNGRAYLYRMAHNLVLDRARGARRRMARDQAWHSDLAGPGPAGEEIADQADPETLAIEREEIARLLGAIATLPEGAQRVLRLHKLEGLSHGEVALRLGISRSGVEKHMAVAMKHLRQAVTD